MKLQELVVPGGSQSPAQALFKTAKFPEASDARLMD